VTGGYEKSSVVYVEAGSDKPPLAIRIVGQERKCMPNRIRKWPLFAQSREMPSIWIGFAA
jgi:hypothetical protein